jgi:DNA helicase-2/ATP-dependent DNA helicase PcrA
VRFYEREEITDALAFLKYIATPRDEVSFRRIVNKPPRGLGEASVDRILDRLGPDGSVPAAVDAALEDFTGRAARALENFRSLHRGLLKSLETDSLSRFVEKLVRDSGLEDYHKNQDEVAGTQKLQNLEELVNAASLYPKGAWGLAEFLEGIELDSARIRDAGDSGDDGARVTLITMHNTKGLEFDRVVVTGMEEGLFPRGGEETEEDIEEERRLFYVAITRARREAYFTCCRNRRLHGRQYAFEPSRFLAELPEEVRGRNTPAAPEDTGFPVGSLVYHEEYGQGIVFRRSFTDGNLAILVRFDSGQAKSFLPKYERRLERVAADGL